MIPENTIPSSDSPELRKLFLLRPDITYLNHGSFGACPRPVFEAYQRWQLELEREPVDFLSLERTFGERMHEAREDLATFLGSATDNLVYVPNATTGLNIVARSLPLQPGDEVLTGDQEYGALDRTWRFICRKRGARYVHREIPLPVESADQVVEAVWSGVNERTRVLFISHITSPTALVMPVAQLVKRAREHGLITVIDGAHAPGQLDLDLTRLGADFYAGNCHKWLMSPKGAGFLHAQPDRQPLLEPLVVSWGFESDDPGSSRFVDEQQWTGTTDVAAYLAVSAALQFRRDYHWPRVQEFCHALVREARQRIGALTGLPPLSPDSPAWFRQMVTLPLPPCDDQKLQDRLRNEFRIEIPVVRWRDRPYLRVSAQGYNSSGDIDNLLAALRRLL